MSPDKVDVDRDDQEMDAGACWTNQRTATRAMMSMNGRYTVLSGAI